MDQEQKKQAVAEAAMEYVESGMIVGVGTGSTANKFIDLLGKRGDIDGAVASSEATAERLRSHSIDIFDLNSTGNIPLYIDGADETTEHRQLIKGGGAALTREKITAAASEKFVCIADNSKLVPVLGKFPLPVEVVPMARSYVARQLLALGGQPQWRQDVITDNGGLILDLYNLSILDPVELETKINQIVGVISVGLFAKRPADIVLLAEDNGILKI